MRKKKLQIKNFSTNTPKEGSEKISYGVGDYC